MSATVARRCSALIPFIGLAFLAASSGAQEAPALPLELLKNGSFEELDTTGSPVGWRAEGLLVPGLTVRAVSSSTGRVGGKVLQLKSEATPALVACFNGPFEVGSVAGQEVEISCLYRTRGLPGAYMDLDTYAEPFAAQGWQTPYLSMEQHALEECGDWALLTWRVRCPAKATEAVLIVAVTGEGELLIDDVSVRPAKPPVRLEPSVLGDLVGWPSRREIRLTVANDTAEARDLKVNVALSQGGRGAQKRTAKVTVAAQAREDVIISYDLPTKDPHQLSLTLDDAATPAVYDTLVAEVPALLTGRVVQPNFRGTLLDSIPAEEIVVEGRIAASEALCGEMALEAELGGAGCIAREGQGITRPDGPASWRLAFPRKGMLTGRYWLNVSAVRGGKPVAVLPLELSRATPTENEVGLDSVGRLLVNGKPVFVNGLYNVTEATDVDRAAAQGFNLVVVPAGSGGSQLIERVRALGLMMVVYSPNPPAQTTGPTPSFWEHTVDKYRTVPGVVAWHLQAAPDSMLMRTGVFRQQQAEMTKIDIYRPVVTRLTIASLLPSYAPWCDIVAFESQPVPALPVDTVAADLEAARAAARPGQPVWAVIQSVGRAWLIRGGGLEAGASGRPPTGAEHRAMTLLALAHGAQGLLHHGFCFSSTKDREEYVLPRDAGDLWDGMKATNALIAQLREAPASGTYRGVAVSGPIHVGAWERDGQLFVLAVNSQPSAALTTFSVPAPAPAGLHRAGDGSEVMKTSKGQFVDELSPYGGRVYTASLAGG
ncbi:MAG: hypothetical protein FJX75_13010 [Armatimonadetes bacterium]|nr:hypothetical protein [Armatimonadota bacterium]